MGTTLTMPSLQQQRLAPAVQRDLPGTGGQANPSVHRPRRLPGPVPHPGPVWLRGGCRHPVARRVGGGPRPGTRPTDRFATMDRGGRDPTIHRRPPAPDGRGLGLNRRPGTHINEIETVPLMPCCGIWMGGLWDRFWRTASTSPPIQRTRLPGGGSDGFSSGPPCPATFKLRVALPNPNRRCCGQKTSPHEEAPSVGRSH